MHQGQQQLVCGNSIKIMNKKLCILDIETTGFEPEDSEILELYILKVVNEEVVDEFYSLFKPSQKIENSHIHGITDEKVQNAPLFKEMDQKIINFVEDAVLVGHNIDYFDLKFLNFYLKRPLKNKTIDTVQLSRNKLSNKVVNHKLITIAEYFNVAKPTHSAKDDVITTFEIYKKLFDENIVKSGPSRQKDWLKGWGENLDNFIKTNKTWFE